MELSIFHLRRSAQIVKYSWWFPVEKNAYDFTKKARRKQNGKFRFSKLVYMHFKNSKRKVEYKLSVYDSIGRYFPPQTRQSVLPILSFSCSLSEVPSSLLLLLLTSLDGIVGSRSYGCSFEMFGIEIELEELSLSTLSEEEDI